MSDQKSTSSSLSAEDIEALGAGLRGELVLPDSDGYDTARLIWNGMFDKRPGLIARCSGTADVIDAVNEADFIIVCDMYTPIEPPPRRSWRISCGKPSASCRHGA